MEILNPEKRVLRSLQAGRGIAAMGVAAFHLSITMGMARYGGVPVFRDITLHGDMGVDFFFVLSGFIIMHAHSADIGVPGRWRNYVYRRLIRIYPIYWLYTAIFSAGLLIGFGTDAVMPHNWRDWVTALTLIRFNNAQPPLSVAWTLFHELAFYAWFLILILNRWLGWLVILVLSMVWLILFQFPSVNERTAFNVYLSVMNLEFLLGVGAYVVYRRIRHAHMVLAVAAMSLLCAILLMRWFEGIGIRILFAIGFAFLTAAFARMESDERIRVPLVITYIGNASYSIYLVHLALEGILLKLILKVAVVGALEPHLLYVLAFGGTIALGCLIFATVEQRILNAFRRWNRGSHPVRHGY